MAKLLRTGLGLAALVGAAEAYLGTPEYEARRRRNLEEPAVGDDWLATVSVPQVIVAEEAQTQWCSELKGQVMEHCKSHLRALDEDDQGDVTDFEDAHVCFVRFRCSQTVVDSGALDAVLKEHKIERNLKVFAEIEAVDEDDNDQDDEVDFEKRGRRRKGRRRRRKGRRRRRKGETEPTPSPSEATPSASPTNGDLADDSQVEKKRARSWGLDRINQYNMPLDGEYSSPYDGSGVNVYVLDTGVLIKHEQFQGRASYGGDFVNEGSKDDLDGHGTHCAGTIGGKDVGVAPGANIIGVKVLGSNGEGTINGVIKGIKWAVDNQKKKHKGKSAVLSLSLSARGDGKKLKNPLSVAADMATKSGHIVVIAAGNYNDDACNLTPQSAGGRGRSEMGPLVVMSSDDDDRRSKFSSHGKCTDLYAPGRDIYSSAVDGKKTNYYTKMSGTSMAAPHVAGVAAQLLQKHKHSMKMAQNELLSNAQEGKMTDNPSCSDNLLLQVASTYHGQPTKAPSMLPQYGPAQFCVGKKCLDWKPASFTPELPLGPMATHDIVFSSSWGNPNGCDMAPRTSENSIKGAVVAVWRGGCTFYQKIENARKRGAAAVLIINDSRAVPVTPGPPFQGAKSDIPSGMISKKDGEYLIKKKVKKIDRKSELLSGNACKPDW